MRKVLLVVVLGLLNVFLYGDGPGLYFRVPPDLFLAILHFLAPGCIVLGVAAIIHELKERAV